MVMDNLSRHVGSRPINPNIVRTVQAMNSDCFIWIKDRGVSSQRFGHGVFDRPDPWHVLHTLTYEWLVSADRTKVHILEHYRIPGLLPHVEKTFSPHAEKFLSFATIDQLFVYGYPTPDIREKLNSFGAIYLAPFVDFTR